MARSMRILFSSTRGAGHLQPLLPYAQALVARGHEVVVAAPAEVGAALNKAGLRHEPFDHPGDQALAPIWARLKGDWTEASMAIAARELFAGAAATAALPKLQETLRAFGPELVVRDSVEYGALVAAEAAGVRHARVAVHSVSFEEPLPALIDEPITALRALAGLPPDKGASLRAEPVFSSFPASLDRVPSASPMQPPFRARVIDEAPSSAPAVWAKSDDPRPLVYITFGTIIGTNALGRSIYRTSLEAVANLPVRALLTTGQDLDPDVLGAIPPNAHVQAWVPQRDVFPHAAALVCHGGSGTLLGGLAAGLPLVIVPFGADQPHNAKLVAAAGAGLASSKPDAGALRAAIEKVLAAPELRREAQRLAGEIAALPTIERAVDVLLGTV
jgi:UDP:flavonoid glycosyltransferase YjiC (YdhE family)